MLLIEWFFQYNHLNWCTVKKTPRLRIKTKHRLNFEFLIQCRLGVSWSIFLPLNQQKAKTKMPLGKLHGLAIADLLFALYSKSCII